MKTYVPDNKKIKSGRPRITNLKQSLLSKTVLSINGCWNFLGIDKGNGYGRIWFNGKSLMAHVVSYKIFKGEIPKGLQIDHLCRNRGCINPDHLEAVTLKENVLRGVGITALNKKKTHCHRGHEFNTENTRIMNNGHRSCKICRGEK